jgi:rhomboid protease GluP
MSNPGYHQTPDAAKLLIDLLYASVAGIFIVPCVVAILRGSPVLRVDRSGLVLRTLFRTRRATWAQLGAFTVLKANKGMGNEKVLRASAPFFERDGSQGRAFLIPNAFNVPFGDVLDAVAQYHGGLAPGTPAVIDPPSIPIGLATFRFPWLTAAIFGVLLAVFILEQLLPVTPPPQAFAPSLDTLIAMGGLNAALVREGQWYRLFTAPLLHSGLAHLVLNGLVLALAGYSLERVIGRAWTFTVFAVGALAGSALSMLVSGPSVVSVGGSGAILAMVVCLFCISFRLPVGRIRSRAQIMAARIAVPALLPVGTRTAALHIDYGAHVGGALAGAALGLLLVLAWPEGERLPLFRRAAALAAVCGVVAFGFGGIAAAWSFKNEAAQLGFRIPAAELPRSTMDIDATADSLARQYPLDPVAHFYAAIARLDQSDTDAAEGQLRLAVALIDINPRSTTPQMASNIRALLATTTQAQGWADQAHMIARAPCAARGAAAPAPEMLQRLTDAGLCNK